MCSERWSAAQRSFWQTGLVCRNEIATASVGHEDVRMMDDRQSDTHAAIGPLGCLPPSLPGRQRCARHCPADVIEAALAVQSRAGLQFADPESGVARLKDRNAGAEEFPLMGVGWAETRACRAVVPHICIVAVLVVHCVCIWRCRSSPQQQHTPSTCTPPAQGAGQSRHNQLSPRLPAPIAI